MYPFPCHIMQWKRERSTFTLIFRVSRHITIVELFLINRYPPQSTLEILLDMSMTNYINVCQFNKTCWCQRNLDSTFSLMTKLYNCPQLSVKQYSPTALKGIVSCIAPKQKYLFYYLLFFLYVNLGVPWIALISTHTN